MKNFSMLIAIATTVFFFSAIAFATAPAPAEAPKATGVIRGTVTDHSGTPMAGVKVEAFSCSNEALLSSTVTGKDGQYDMSRLPDGCYHTRYSKTDYQSYWYGAGIRAEAEDIKVSGEAVTGIDGSLSEGHCRITGTIKTSEGAPLPGAWAVAILPPSKEGGGSVSDGIADANGIFTINVSPGKHVVVFGKRGYVTRIYGNSLTKPSMLDVADGKPASGIDASLAHGGVISGSVRNEAGKELPDIRVVAMAPAGDILPVSGRTDDSGNFSIEGLPTGKFKVVFGDKENKYLSQWYDGKASLEDATLVSVTAPAVTSGIRGILHQGGGFAGKVTDPEGNPISRVDVVAESVNNGAGFGFAVTDINGEYQVNGLATGNYRVSYRATDGAGRLPRYYQDAATRESAAPVEVVAGQVTFNIDAVLPQGRMISGVVKNASDAPVAGAAVMAYPALKKSKDEPTFAITDDRGAFTVAVAEGDYVVEVRATGYLTQWSGSRASREEAAVITASKEKEVGQVDFTLLSGGSIAGMVRNRVGVGIAKVRVAASDATTGQHEQSATTDDSGKYHITALQAGTYRLSADGSAAGYIEASLPQPVALAGLGAQAENADFVLTAGGSISGKVTGADGIPAAWASVGVYDPATWDEVARSSTEQDGQYKIGGVPEGRYCIRYQSSKYPVQWYKGKFRREDSTQVEVRGTGSVTGVDAVLTSGLALSGMVTDTAGTPLPEVKVEVYGGSEDEPVTEVNTDVTGRYTVPALASGAYRFRFSVDGYVPRWIGGSDRRSATPVRIDDVDVAGVNVVMVKAIGKLSGKLMNPEGHKVGQAWLTVFDATTGAAVADERICECNGLFDTPVPGGWYRLRVERHGKVFWYRGTSQDDAAALPGSGDLSGLNMVIDDTGVKNKQAQDKSR